MQCAPIAIAMKYTKNRKYVHHHHFRDFDNMEYASHERPKTKYTIRICTEPRPNQMLSDGFM